MSGAAKPRVAVLMSTYNGAAFLEAQLASLAAQTDVETHLFVRDDGSSDGTLDILARWADRWPSVAAPASGPNLGPAMSFLTLLQTAPDGFDAYAFCDQDDVWLPDKLSRAVAALATVHPGAAALYCSQVTCVDEALRRIGEPFSDRDSRYTHLLFENIAYGVTIVMNPAAREAVAGASPGRGAIMHDWWCALVASALGQVVHDPRPGVLYRQHRRNVIGARTGVAAELARQVRALLRDRARYWPVHAQAAELLRLFGDRLRPEDARAARALVASKAALRTRLGYALGGGIVRSKWYGALAARALVAVGWY